MKASDYWEEQARDIARVNLELRDEVARLEAERDEEKTLLRFLEEGQPDPFDGELTERADYFIRLARDENAEWQRERDRAEAAEDRVRLLGAANTALIEGVETLRESGRLHAEALSAIDRYSCYGTPWNAYVDVKRIARQALEAALAGSVDTTPEPEEQT